MVHPLCFLYLQYLELTLKSIIDDCGALLGKFEKTEQGHEIPKLRRKCKELLTETYDEDFSNKIFEIENRINKFLSIAPSRDAFAFRYPISKTQEPSFPKPHNVNVRVLGEEMHEIWSFFFGISNDIAERMKSVP